MVVVVVVMEWRDNIGWSMERQEAGIVDKRTDRFADTLMSMKNEKFK